MSKQQLNTKEKNIGIIIKSISWIMILICAGLFVKFFLLSSNYINTNDAQIEQYITPISSKVSGFVMKINYKENQFVKKGDTLIIIDNRLLHNDLHKTQAIVEANQSNMTTYDIATSAKSSELSVIDATIEGLEAELWQKKQDYDRFHNLLLENAATEQEFETKKVAYDVVVSKINAAKAQKRSIELASQQISAQKTPINANIKGYQSDMDNTELMIGYTYIIAPYDGWMGKKSIQEQEYIKEGQSLALIVSAEKWIIANYKETQIGEIDTTKTFEIVADAYPNIKFKAHYQSMSAASGSKFSLIQPDNATGNFVKIEQRFPIKLILEPNEQLTLLKAGMNLSIHAPKMK